jgi:hypothetical protein
MEVDIGCDNLWVIGRPRLLESDLNPNYERALSPRTTYEL